jgi:hypothetical protein
MIVPTETIDGLVTEPWTGPLSIEGAAAATSAFWQMRGVMALNGLADLGRASGPRRLHIDCSAALDGG